MKINLRQFFEANGWCQKELARDEAGKGCDFFSRWATSWSLFGAMMLLHPDDYRRVYSLVDAQLVGLHPALKTALNPIIVWNDAKGRTKQQVIELCQTLDI